MSGVLRYEWRRITTVRATWILLSIAAAIPVVISLLMFIFLHNDTGQSGIDGPATDDGLNQLVGIIVGNIATLVLLGTVAAQAFGQDYRHGTIRLTLTAFPRRLPVFIAKIMICALLISITYLISLAVSTVLLVQVGSRFGVELSVTDMAGFWFRSWVNLMGFCLIIFALTVLTRILALGIIIPVITAAVVEGLLTAFLSARFEWLPKVLPFTSGTDFMIGVDTVRSGLVYLVWVLVLIIPAAVVFQKRDA